MLGQAVFLDSASELYVNTLENLDGHTCNIEMNHNYDQTIYKKVAKENEAQFNCTVPFHPTMTSQLTGSIIEICNNSETGKNALRNWWTNAYTTTNKSKPCTEMVIYLGIPDISNGKSDNESFLHVYLKSDMKVKSIILYYDLTTLAADIGGYIGMFLGVSLIDVTMMCNSALFKIVAMKLK